MVKRRQSKKNNNWVIVLGLLSLLAIIMFNFYQGYQDLNRLDKEMKVLEKDIKKLNHQNQKLQDQVTHVNSKKFIERIAREELGLVKKGEILYITVE